MGNADKTPDTVIQTPSMRTMDRRGIYYYKRMTNFFWEIVDLLSYKHERFAAVYERFIGEEYKNEYRASGIKKTDKVLHIGCGAYPLSEIALASIFGAHIVGIDKNPKAVKLASEVVKHKKLEKQISIQHGNGVDFAVDGFDVIIVSGCSLPKVKILDNVFKMAKKKSMIIVREIEFATREVYDCVNAYQGITVSKKIRIDPGVPLLGWHTIFLTKK